MPAVIPARAATLGRAWDRLRPIDVAQPRPDQLARGMRLA